MICHCPAGRSRLRGLEALRRHRGATVVKTAMRGPGHQSIVTLGATSPWFAMLDLSPLSAPTQHTHRCGVAPGCCEVWQPRPAPYTSDEQT